MSEDIVRKVNISFPNLVNICVDEEKKGEISGRVYQYYTEEPWHFKNVIQLLRILEKFYDGINFPQASTKTRLFREKDIQDHMEWERRNDAEEVLSHRGELGSFVSCVQYRQNSTWQGTLFWIEKDEGRRYASSLEFIKLLDNAIEVGEP